MRVALISDIHGNQIALEIVLTDIKRHRPDGIICLGDVATLGPQPKQVLATLQTLDCIFIEGNHDAAMLAPETAVSLSIAPPLHPALRWAVAQLNAYDITFIQSFVPTYRLSLGSQTTLHCFHGSPQATTDIILATTPTAELDTLLGPDQAEVMVGGHTHIQMLRQHRGKRIINPGSVGLSFVQPIIETSTPALLPWAEYALITFQAGTLDVQLKRLPFDKTAVLHAIQQSDIPLKAWLKQQYQSI